MRCDFPGCKGIPFAEVYKLNGTWHYLCKKHYKTEYIIHGTRYGWYELTFVERIRTFLNLYLWMLKK